MNKINRRFGFTLSIALISLIATSLDAREYEYDRDGNVNVNIIDREVSVNGEQVGIISSVERVSVGDEYDVGIDEDDVIDVEMEEGEITVGDDVSIDSDTINSFFEE